jgi:DNA-binding transcriptional regulator GbsR (MarR family)
MKKTTSSMALYEKFLQTEEPEKMNTDEKRAFMEAVANYHSIGENIYRANKLKETAANMAAIIEAAEQLTLQESEHWFDNVTVSRHMKQLKEAYNVFEKTSGEMDGLQQRLESAYEDMGSVLNKYYKVNGAIS